MAELTQVEPTQEIPENNDSPTTEPTTEPSIEERIAEVEARLAEKFKTDIAGLNRKVSEVTKERDELKKKTMTDEEVRAAEIEEERQLRIAAETKAEALERKQIIDVELAGVGLPLEFAKYISGKEESEIKTNVNELSEYIKDTANKLKEQEINQRLSGKAPVAGSSPDVSDLQASYNEAKKAGNTALMTAIKRKGRSEGVTIT